MHFILLDRGRLYIRTHTHSKSFFLAFVPWCGKNDTLSHFLPTKISIPYGAYAAQTSTVRHNTLILFFQIVKIRPRLDFLNFFCNFSLHDFLNFSTKIEKKESFLVLYYPFKVSHYEQILVSFVINQNKFVH